MKISVFDTHRYERDALVAANVDYGFELQFFEARLSLQTVDLAQGSAVVCPFVNDHLDADVLARLNALGVKLVAIRAAGFNGVDLAAAKALQLPVVRVPAYSPHAVAEHAFALLLTLVRKTHRAYNRVREGNFALDGLVGFDVYGKTIGIVGTGRIGKVAAQIARGFGCTVLAYDIAPDSEWAAQQNVRYVDLDSLLANSDVVSLHVPLTNDSRHLMDAQALSRLKAGAILINTSRGALIDTKALIQVLKRGTLAGVGLDVYEQEEGVFFENQGDHPLQDDVLARLLTFPNVLLTSHQGFLTREALGNIATTTLENCRAFAAGEALVNRVPGSV